MLKELHNLCFDCGNKIGKFKGGSVGSWMAVCDNCGEEKPCADAGHDFGVYNNDLERLHDLEQRKI